MAAGTQYRPGMSENYVIVAQVSGFGEDDTEDKLAELDRNLGEETRCGGFERDDGTGEILFTWHPQVDPMDAEAWNASLPAIEKVRSAVTGAGFVFLNPVKVELRDEAESKAKHPTARKAPAKKKAASAYK